MMFMRDEFIKKFYYLFWIFMVGCVVGWAIEGVYSLVRYGGLINHSALVIGPFNAAYGFSACALSALLASYQDKGYFKIFFIGFLGGSILEYIMSWGMELILGFTAWDYSSKFLNINGRICFTYSLFWGILSIFWIKFIYPFLIKLIDRFDFELGKKIMIGFLIFLAIDLLLTFSAVSRARKWEQGIPPNNSYERFLDQTFNQKYLKNMYNNSWVINNENCCFYL